MGDAQIILIVEDNDVTRSLMESVLQSGGYQTIGAEDGRGALRILESTPIALAFVDLNMEPMGGFDFIRNVREHNAEIKDMAGRKHHFPIVIVTADESSDVLVLAQEHGAAQLFKKPVDPARLLATTRKLLAL